jgi:hypothetical protein
MEMKNDSQWKMLSDGGMVMHIQWINVLEMVE